MAVISLGAYFFYKKSKELQRQLEDSKAREGVLVSKIMADKRAAAKQQLSDSQIVNEKAERLKKLAEMVRNNEESPSVVSDELDKWLREQSAGRGN